MWVDSSFAVNGRRVGVSVKQLDVDEANRLAAQLAWCARVADHGIDASAWARMLQAILADYVEMTMDKEVVEELDTISTAVCAGAFDAFIRVNHLERSIKACLFHDSECVN